MKKSVCLLLTAICVFAGCSQKEKSKTSNEIIDEGSVPVEKVVEKEIVIKEVFLEVTKRMYKDKEVRKIDVDLTFDKVMELNSFTGDVITFQKLSADEKLVLSKSGAFSEKDGREIFSPKKFVEVDTSLITEEGKSAVLVARKNDNIRDIFFVDGNEGKASLLFTVFKRDLDSSQNMKTLVIHSKNEKNIISGKEKPKLYTFYIPDFNKKYKNGVFTELGSYGCIENIESNEMFYNVLGECVYGKWKVITDPVPEIKVTYYPDCYKTCFDEIEENELFWNEGIITPKPKIPKRISNRIEEKHLSKGEYVLISDDNEIIYINFSNENGRETELLWSGHYEATSKSFGTVISEEDVLKKEVYEIDRGVEGKITMKDGKIYTARFEW